jgi:Tol biopolymer transport system component
MSARARYRRSATVALVASVTAGIGLVLTGCGPEDATGADGSGTSATSTPTGGADQGSGADGQPAASTSDKPAPKVNGTAHNGLTISDGTRYVVMNGTRVDFGTEVRDLAWSPDGGKAAFVDGDGDLVVSNPDGSGRTVVAKNPGGQNWSHPTWQTRAADTQNGVPEVNNLLFAARKDGVTRLYGVPATAHNATPAVLPLNHESGENAKPLPQTGNTWPDSAGTYGDAVYANTGDGQVYIRDDYLRQQGAPITKGSEPALSPRQDDGFVFVRSVGGHDHLFRETPSDGGPVFKDLTPNASTDYTEPAFSPDGKTLAARTPAGIVTLPADGSAAPVKVSDYTGLPAFRG